MPSPAPPDPREPEPASPAPAAEPPLATGRTALARETLARRKRRDAAIVLPLGTLVLFASPLLDLVAGAGRLAGVPVSVLYIFGAWFAVIAITAGLSRRLMRDGGEG